MERELLVALAVFAEEQKSKIARPFSLTTNLSLSFEANQNRRLKLLKAWCLSSSLICLSMLSLPPWRQLANLPPSMSRPTYPLNHSTLPPWGPMEGPSASRSLCKLMSLLTPASIHPVIFARHPQQIHVSLPSSSLSAAPARLVYYPTAG